MPSRLKRLGLEPTPTPSFQVAQREYSGTVATVSNTAGGRIQSSRYVCLCRHLCDILLQVRAELRLHLAAVVEICGLPEAVFQPIRSTTRRKYDSHSSVLSLFFAANSRPPGLCFTTFQKYDFGSRLPAVTPGGRGEAGKQTRYRGANKKNTQEGRKPKVIRRLLERNATLLLILRAAAAVGRPGLAVARIDLRRSGFWCRSGKSKRGVNAAAWKLPDRNGCFKTPVTELRVEEWRRKMNQGSDSQGLGFTRIALFL